jgi:DNA sulfur modification protein DndB
MLERAEAKESSAGLLRIRRCGSIEEAQHAAGEHAQAMEGGAVVPAVVFEQGQRTLLACVLSMNWIASHAEAKPAAKGAPVSAALEALNRPIVPTHYRAIARYLREHYRQRYIIPPLTLNLAEPAAVYTLEFRDAPGLMGYLVLPPNARMTITDGQHRQCGIAEFLNELRHEKPEDYAQASRNGVPVMIVPESNIVQAHQDFADCSKVKALPQSLLTLYDTRNPGNRLVVDLEQACVLFRGRIDSTNKILSRNSTFLFLMNQVRQLVKELLCGSYALPDHEFARRAHEQLSKKHQYDDALEKFSAYVNEVTKALAVWNRIAKLPDTVEAGTIPALRAEGWLCLTATGLNLIGRVGHLLFRNGVDDWRVYAARLGEINWKRSADFWNGNVVQDNRILTQQGPLRSAVEKVCETIGLTRRLAAPGASRKDEETPSRATAE